jgi:hypothetical protein
MTHLTGFKFEADIAGQRMRLRYLTAVVLIASATLQGCGGGGSDAGTAVAPVTPVATFPLLAGYKARIAAGASDSYTVSGTCAGNAAITSAAAASATFEGVTGYSVAQTATINFTNCTPASSAVTSTGYYDANYSPLGSTTPGVDYAKYVTAPAALPLFVKVGDTAAFATFTVYSDSAKATVTGQRVLSYVIEADTTTTAVANLITKAYNASGQLLTTQQARYRIAADGSLTVISIDVQYSTTSTNHLLYIKA